MSPRDPRSVPVTVVRTDEQLAAFARAVRAAVGLAIDTETVYRRPAGGTGTGEGAVEARGAGEPGRLRVLSAATRAADGGERAWVVDARDADRRALAAALDGVAADAWNATFDARVTDRDLFAPAGLPRHRGIRWWDAQLADAVLHAGITGFGWFHGLAWATERYLGVTAEGKGSVQLSFDAVGDLSDEQVSYAAADAVETLWVADELRRRLAAEGLAETADLESRARPFLDHLSRCGVPLDRRGFVAAIERRREALRSCLTALAELTGGGQGNLFDPEVEPSWNPASEAQAKAALNRWATHEVKALLARREGRPRLLAPADPLDAATLAQLGGPLAAALAEFRGHAKLAGSYGDNLLPLLGDDGRFHPQYVQVVGVNTGRLSSRYPNAQTFPPEVASHLRPERPDRVFVHADVAQAELRWLAQVSGDEALRAAFRGGLDVHAATAERAFRADMEALERDDPTRFRALRSRAKAIGFGLVYGQGATGLARSLELAGVPTTAEEAQALLDDYLDAHPAVAAWLASQDEVVDRVAAAVEATGPGPGGVDWSKTMRLYDDLVQVTALRREFREAHRRWPTAAEVLDALPAVAPWVLTFEDAVVLDGEGRAVSWASRTLAGRRRLFTVATAAVLRRAAVAAASADDVPALVEVRRAFSAATGVPVPAPGPALERLFDDRTLRRSYVGRVARALGRAGVGELLRAAAGQSVRAAGNAFRNAPIQGGVADAMLAAYADLWARIGPDPDVLPTLSVHDSLVVECHLDRADEVAGHVAAALRVGFGRFCPDVPLAVDLDVRASLSDDDVLRRIDAEPAVCPRPGRAAPAPRPGRAAAALAVDGCGPGVSNLRP